MKRYTLHDFFQGEEFLGRGQFGIVVSCVFKKDNQIVVKKQSIKKRNDDLLRNELNVLSRLNHPNIPKGYGFIESPSFCIIMEKKAGVLLGDYIFHPSPYENGDDTVFCILLQIAGIMSYLHTRHVIFRDLKPDNLLIIPDTLEINLIDFGLAVYLGETSPFITGIVGTRGYIAPEVLRFKSYTYSADVYSFGKTILCMYLFPYVATHKKMPRKDAPMNKFLYFLMKKCCQDNPRQRPSMASVYDYLRDRSLTPTCWDRFKYFLGF